MSVTIQIANPDLSNQERTYLTAAYSTGTTLTVRNNEGFNHTNDFVVVGEPGQERTELQSITSITSTGTITIGTALGFSHEINTPVYLSEWKQIAVERKDGGSFAPVTSSPSSNEFFDIEWDDSSLFTTIKDPTGVETSIYRWRFYNPDSATYSSYSGELPASGLEKLSAGYALVQIRNNKRIGRNVDDATIFGFFTDFQDMIYEQMPTAWWFTKEGTALATAVDTYRYSISDNWEDLASIKYLLYNYATTGTNQTYPIDFVSELVFRNYKSDPGNPSDDHVMKWTLLPPDDNSDLGYIGLHPTPKTTNNRITPIYEIVIDTITSFSDRLVIPSVKGYVDYAFYRIFDELFNDTIEADKYNARLQADIKALHQRKKRNMGQDRFRRYRGQKGYNNLFRGQGMSSDAQREYYW